MLSLKSWKSENTQRLLRLPPTRRATRLGIEQLENKVLLSAGDLDLGFGGNGSVVTDFTSLIDTADDARSVVTLDNGRVLVAGRSRFGGQDVGSIARYNSNGSLDPTFGIGGRLVLTQLYEVNDILSLPDGGILATGSFNGPTSSDFGIMKLTSHGSIDTGFGSRGLATADFASDEDFPHAIVVQQTDNKIVVSGTSFNGTDFDFAVARFSDRGNLDFSFDADGKQTIDFNGRDDIAYDLELDALNRITLVGSADSLNRGLDFALARLDPGGMADNSFGTNGKVTTDFGQNRNDEAFSAVLQSNGVIVAGGYSEQQKIGRTDEDFAMARYQVNGSLLGGFGNNGKVLTDFSRVDPSDDRIGEIAIQSDGKIVAAGEGFEPSVIQSTILAARYDGLTGQLDTNVDPDSGGRVFLTLFTHTLNSSQAIAIQPNGKWILAGESSASNFGNYGIVRMDSGVLDTSFGNGGRVITDFTDLIGSFDEAHSVNILADGKILVAGETEFSGRTYGSIVRYNVDGSRDFSFGVAGKITTDLLNGINAIVVSSNGDIYATGPSFPPGTDHDFGVIKILTNGSLDSNFGTNGLASVDFHSFNDTPRAIALQSDGNIVLAGEAFNGFDTDFAIARFNPNGNLDSSFDNDGKQTIDFNSFDDVAYSIQIDNSNRMVLAGSAESATAGRDFALSRLDPGGMPDNTFGTNGKVTTDFGQNRDDEAFSVMIQPGNPSTIIAAGYARQQKIGRTDDDFALARYGNNGQLLLGFGLNGRTVTDFTTNTSFPSDDRVGEIALQGNGQIVAAGSAFDFLEGTTFALGRYGGSNGQLDSNLDPNTGGRMRTSFFADQASAANAMRIQPDGKLVLAGGTGLFPGENFAVSRLDPLNGNVDQGFGNQGRVVTDFIEFIGTDNEAQAVVVQVDNRILTGGFAFSTDSSLQSFGTLARFNSDGSPDLNFGVNGQITTGLLSEITDITVLSDGSILATGPTRNPGGDSDFGVIKILRDATLVRTFGMRGLATVDFNGNNDVARALVVQPNGRIVVAGTAQNQDFDFGIARFTTAGILDNTFDNDGKTTVDFHNFDDHAHDILLDSLGRVVAVGSAVSPANGDMDFALARLDPGGMPDNTFGTNGKITTDFGQNRDDEAFSAVIQPGDTIVAAGLSFQQKTGRTDSDFALARYSSQGLLLGGFGNNGKVITDFSRNLPSDDRINQIAVQGDQIIAVGESFEDFFNGRNEIALAVYDGVTGQIDSSVDANTGGRVYLSLFAPSDFDGSNALAVQSDGKWVSAGSSGSFPLNDGLVRFEGMATTAQSTDLAITSLTGLPETVSPGGPLVYDIGVINNGQNTSTGVVVTDSLPNGLTFDASASTIGCTGAGQTVTCILGSLSNGESRVISIGTTVSATLTGLVINTASITGALADSNQNNNSRTVTTAVQVDSGDFDIAVTGFSHSNLINLALQYTITGSAANQVPLRFFASNDGRFDFGDTPIGSTLTINSPSDLTPGLHNMTLDASVLDRFLIDPDVPFILAVADPDRLVTESSESNNDLNFRGVFHRPSTGEVIVRGNDTSGRGTLNADDTLRASSPGAILNIRFNGELVSVQESAVSHMILLGNDGRDDMRIDPSVTLPTDLRGGDGNDILVGGSGNDTISGDAGGDILNGRSGDDRLDGDGTSGLQGSRDIIFGQDGNDVLIGGVGNDRLVGMAGNDLIIAGDGNDAVLGRDGDDTLLGNDGDDILIGGRNDDQIDGGANNDRLFGSSGNDLLNGGFGEDKLRGGAGNDQLNGTDSNRIDNAIDRIFCEAGLDEIFGLFDAADFVKKSQCELDRRS